MLLLSGNAPADQPDSALVGTWLLERTEAPDDRDGHLNHLQMQLTIYTSGDVSIISLNRRNGVPRAESDQGSLKDNSLSLTSGPIFQTSFRDKRLILTVEKPNARFIYRQIDNIDISSYSSSGNWIYSPPAGNPGGIYLRLNRDGSGLMGVSESVGVSIRWQDDGDTVSISPPNHTRRIERNPTLNRNEIMLTKTALADVMTLETQDERKRIFLVRTD